MKVRGKKKTFWKGRYIFQENWFPSFVKVWKQFRRNFAFHGWKIKCGPENQNLSGYLFFHELKWNKCLHFPGLFFFLMHDTEWWNWKIIFLMCEWWRKVLAWEPQFSKIFFYPCVNPSETKTKEFRRILWNLIKKKMGKSFFYLWKSE